MQKISVPTSVSTSNVTLRWFALRVKSRCEKVVATIAHNKGFEEFLPLYRDSHRWSDRVKAVELPLFPGYVFCRMDPQKRLPLLTIPGALHFVGIGRTPTPLDDAEITSIRAAAGTGLFMEPWEFLECGQRVRLNDGPLTGMEGFIVGTSKPERVVVSVSLLKRSVAVAIEHEWAVPLDRDGRKPNE